MSALGDVDDVLAGAVGEDGAPALEAGAIEEAGAGEEAAVGEATTGEAATALPGTDPLEPAIPAGGSAC